MFYDVYRSTKRPDVEFYVTVGTQPNFPPDIQLQFAPFQFARRHHSIPWLSSLPEATLEQNVRMYGYHVAPAISTVSANSTASAVIGGGLLGAGLGGVPGAVLGALAGLAVAESARKKKT